MAKPIHQLAATIKGGIHILLPYLGGQNASGRGLELFSGALFLLLPTQTHHTRLSWYIRYGWASYARA